jgi:hypothetical protein
LENEKEAFPNPYGSGCDADKEGEIRQGGIEHQAGDGCLSGDEFELDQSHEKYEQKAKDYGQKKFYNQAPPAQDSIPAVDCLFQSSARFIE